MFCNRYSEVFRSTILKIEAGGGHVSAIRSLVRKCAIRHTKFRLLAGVSGLVLSASAGTALADTLWQGNISSDWHEAGNWNNGVPNPTEAAEIRDPTTSGEPVRLASGTGEADQIRIGAGNSVIVSGSATKLDLADMIRIGLGASADESSLTIQSAAEVNAQRVSIGDGSGAGMLTVTGPGSSLNVLSSEFKVGATSSGRLIIADGGTVNTGGNKVLNLGSGSVIGRLAIGTGGDAGFLDAQEVRMNNVASRVVFDVATDSTFGSLITGSGFLRKKGTGTVTLTGANTYTGLTYIDQGTLALSGQGRIDLSATVIVNGTLDVSAASAPSIKALRGNGSIVLGSKNLTINNAYDTFSGVISGSGGLYINSGLQTLTGANTFTGETEIAASATLEIGDGGSIAGDIANAGLLVFNRSDNSTYSGIISGLGNFELSGGGKLTLTGTSSTRGMVLIDPGNALQLGDGGNSGWIGGTGSFVGQILNHGTLIYNRADDVSYNGIISGIGGLTKLGAGSLRLTNEANYTGTTDVFAGSLIIDGYAVSSILTTIHGGAALGGTGTLGATTVLANATHAPGNSIGTQTISGDYTNHGTLAIEVTPAEADRVIVQGAVDISGATLALTGTPLTIADWPLLNGPYIIIDNQDASAVTGTFASVTNNLLFLDETVDYTGGDGNDVTLELTRNETSFADLGRTPNQRETGAGADTLTMTNPIWQTLVGMTDEDMVRASLDSLSGEVHPSFQGALNRSSAFLRNAANDRIRAAFATSGETSRELSHGLAFWSEAYGAWADFDSDGNAAAMDLSSGGVFVGADALAGNWRFGLLGGYGQSKLDVAKVASSAESKDYHLGIYAGTELGRLGIRTGAGYSWHSIDTARNVQAGAFTDSLSADYDASTFQAFGEMSYRLDLSSARLEPFVNLAYVHQSSDGFTEKGGAAALTVNGRPMDTGYATVGARMEHAFQLDTIKATAKATLGWQMAFGDTKPTSVHSFAGSSDFLIAGVPIARNAALIEAGVDVDLTPKSTLGLSYRGQIAENARQHEINGMLSIRF